MRAFLVEDKGHAPIKHVQAKNAKEACQQFAHLLACTLPPKLVAHELHKDEFCNINGKEDCSECFEYLHTQERYYCHTLNCDTQGALFSQYDINECGGQVNCEYCDKPLRKIKPE